MIAALRCRHQSIIFCLRTDKVVTDDIVLEDAAYQKSSNLVPVALQLDLHNLDHEQTQKWGHHAPEH